MMILLWSAPGQIFDPVICEDAVKNKTDVPMFQAHITHQEGQPAQAMVHVPAHAVYQQAELLQGFDQARWAWIVYGHMDAASPREVREWQLVMAGRVTGYDSQGPSGIVALSLVAQAPDWQHTQWPALAQEVLNPLPSHVRTWVGLDVTSDWPTVLAHTPYVLCWDRTHGQTHLSPVMGQDRASIIDGNALIDRHTLISWDKPPIQAMDVRLSAQWVQTRLGWLDCAGLVAQQFRHGVIATYTPGSLIRAWPQPGRAIGHAGISGYRVAASELTVDPAYEDHSPFLAKDALYPVPGPKDSRAKATARIARKYVFQAALWVVYTFQQKHHEELTCTVKASLRAPVHNGGRASVELVLPSLQASAYSPMHWAPFCAWIKNTRVYYQGTVWQAVQDVGPSEVFDPTQWYPMPSNTWGNIDQSSSFFGSWAGYEVFDYALAVAQTKLLWGTRCRFVQVWGPVASLLHVGVDQTVTLTDARLGPRPFVGKVIAWHLVADAQTGQWRIKLTLAGLAPCTHQDPSMPVLAPGASAADEDGEAETESMGKGQYSKGYVQEGYHGQKTWRMQGRVGYYRWDDQVHRQLAYIRSDGTKGTVDADPLPAVHVRVENQASDQEVYLDTLVHRQEDPSLLRGHETRIHIHFAKCATQDCWHKEIRPVVSMWSAGLEHCHDDRTGVDENHEGKGDQGVHDF